MNGVNVKNMTKGERSRYAAALSKSIRAREKEQGMKETKMTTKQIRQQSAEKIKAMRKACDYLTDDNAIEAVFALGSAENCYAKIQTSRVRHQLVLHYHDLFLMFEKSFWKAIKRGAA